MPQAAEGQPDTVLVPEAVAGDLFGHLQQQGRITAFTSAVDAHTKLGTIMAREWGTGKVRRFTDEPGGGWLIDISTYVDGEALYAMVRTVFGRRTVTAIVDEEEVEGFLAGNGWETEAAKGTTPPGIDAEALAEAEAIEQGRQRQPVRPPASKVPASDAAPTPVREDGLDAPAMVVILAPVTSHGKPPTIAHYERCTRGEVPDVVKRLLRSGASEAGGSISEEQIEIWGCLSKPTLEVKF